MGVESAAIVTENERPGSADWQIAPRGGPPVEGYANQTQTTAGSTVRLYVSPQPAGLPADEGDVDDLLPLVAFADRSGHR